MTPNFKPLLAASPWRVKDDLEPAAKMAVLMSLRYPVLATPKFDGIRVTTADYVPAPEKLSVPVCRSLLQLPNDYVRGCLALLPPGYDGEVLTYEEPELFNAQSIVPITIESKPRDFGRIQSDLMSEDGYPVFRFMIFDFFDFADREEPYKRRAEDLALHVLPPYCIKVLPVVCNTAQELWDYSEKCLAMGYEGCCFRTPESPAWKASSKDGRASLKEQWLVKMKLFDRGEAVIIGAYEEMGNNNPITLNEKGLAERSSHKANMTGKGSLGGFRVRDCETGVEFNVGGGFTATQRKNMWDVWTTARNQLEGKTLTYLHQPHGAKDRPRIGIFKGFRDTRDMS